MCETQSFLLHFAQDITSALATFLRHVEHRFTVDGALTVSLVGTGTGTGTGADILDQRLLLLSATFSQFFSPAAKVRRAGTTDAPFLA